MRKKKIIISCIFLALILVTIIATAVAAAETYQDEIRNHDILEGLGAAIVVGAGGFAAFYELDLFCTVRYLLFKPKSTPKTVFCLLANLCLILVFVYSDLSNRFMALRKYEITPAILFGLYTVFRIVYAFTTARESDHE